ncbi:DoxX family protein [Streptomyces apocyni]|uniref:DoxX family protein n=1 Tax=Streptomyces apocyni TaxID=2654677 RepID=UPI0012EA3710|nr:DoxX family protein [Streptomyces apocyni]
MAAEIATASTVLAAAAPVSPARATAPVRGRHATIALRALRIALALFFGVASGAPKLFAVPAAQETFDQIGAGDWLMYVVGGLEVLGAIALLIPMLSGVSAIAFIGLMTGATVTSVTALGGEFWYTPLVLIVPLVLIARVQRHETVRLVTTARQVVARKRR